MRARRPVPPGRLPLTRGHVPGPSSTARPAAEPICALRRGRTPVRALGGDLARPSNARRLRSVNPRLRCRLLRWLGNRPCGGLAQRLVEAVSQLLAHRLLVHLAGVLGGRCDELVDVALVRQEDQRGAVLGELRAPRRALPAVPRKRAPGLRGRSSQDGPLEGQTEWTGPAAREGRRLRVPESCRQRIEVCRVHTRNVPYARPVYPRPSRRTGSCTSLHAPRSMCRCTGSTPGSGRRWWKARTARW